MLLLLLPPVHIHEGATKCLLRRDGDSTCSHTIACLPDLGRTHLLPSSLSHSSLTTANLHAGTMPYIVMPGALKQIKTDVVLHILDRGQVFALRAHCVRTACILHTQRPGYSPKNTSHLTGCTAKQQSPHENDETAFNLVPWST